TNALLERKGARIALLTTEGFEDVIIIGRQTRRELYNIFVTRPEPLVPDGLRFGVRERMLYDGSVEQPLDQSHLRSVIDEVQKKDVESIAVSFLYSFANTAHEDTVLAALESLGLPVSLSSRILPEYREYERTLTTVINAYLAPVMSRYLLRLRRRLGEMGSDPSSPEKRDEGSDPVPLRVMQSNGGGGGTPPPARAPPRSTPSALPGVGGGARPVWAGSGR